VGAEKLFFSCKPTPSTNETSSTPSASHGSCCDIPQPGGVRLKPVVLGLAVALAAAAGAMDWRSRRIPNWLTVPGLLVGIAANAATGGLSGLKTSLLGAGLGLLLLLPFVFLRSLGAGDWKLAGALGAFVGPGVLLDLLMGSIFVAGIMALGLVIYKRRLIETLRNIGRMLGSMLTFRMPGSEVSLDNPQSLKIPYGVALALTTLLYGILNWKMWGAR
jgi:prepilin peptidase CpaA